MMTTMNVTALMFDNMVVVDRVMECRFVLRGRAMLIGRHGDGFEMG